MTAQTNQNISAKERRDSKENEGNFWKDLEAQILEDLKKGVPWNVICKNHHISSKTVAKIKEKYADSRTSDGEISALAFSLFEMGRNPVEVVIELKQPPENIIKLYESWRKIKQDLRTYTYFTVKCAICKKTLFLSSNNVEWKEKIKPTLLKAFENWAHAECVGESNTTASAN